MDDGILLFLPGALHIGVPEIDSQHDAIFGRMVAMKELCLRNNALSLDDVGDLLEALRTHYATEEALAGRLALDFTEHAKGHREMLQMVGKALNDAVEGKADVFGTLRYIEYWFERHIAQEDRVLGQLAG